MIKKMLSKIVLKLSSAKWYVLRNYKTLLRNNIHIWIIQKWNLHLQHVSNFYHAICKPSRTILLKIPVKLHKTQLSTIWNPVACYFCLITTLRLINQRVCGKQPPLQWRHNERGGVSNHQPHDCLLNRLFKAQIKENTKALRHWPLWV